MPKGDPARGSETMAEATETKQFNLLKPFKEDYGTLRNFIDGEWVESQTERFLDIHDPATGGVIGKVPLSTKAEVDKAIKAAHDAYWDWRSTPPIVRARSMFKIKDLLEKNFAEDSRIPAREP